MYGLQNTEIEEIKNIFRTFPKIREVILFGSRAKGTFREGSDVDLAIKGENLTHDDLLNLQLALEDLGMLYKFDIQDFNKIKEKALTDHILRVGIPFFKQQES